MSDLKLKNYRVVIYGHCDVEAENTEAAKEIVEADLARTGDRTDCEYVIQVAANAPEEIK